MVLIITAREERANKLVFVNAILGSAPISNSLVNVVRCVAIVGRFLRFELIKKLLVVFVLTIGGIIPPVTLVKPACRVSYAEIKVKPLEIQPFNILRQQIQIPRAFVELVIQDPVFLDLLVSQVIGDQARNFLLLEFLGGKQPAMADHDNAIFVDNKRLQPTQFLDGLSHVVDLPLIMRFGVLLIRRQF